MFDKMQIDSSLYACLKLAAISLFLFSCKPTALHGQGEESKGDKVAAIRQQIAAYQEKIEPCKWGEPCGAFSNRSIINEHKGPWPAVGTYQIERTYWYHRFFKEEAGEYAYQLDMVLVKTKRSAREESEMVFFDETGELVYYEFLLGDPKSHSQRIQFYFEAEKVLQFKSEIAEGEKDYQRWIEGDAAKVQQIGTLYQENFQLDMREE